MESEPKFKCEKCNYFTEYKYSYNKHLQSGLHLNGERKIRSDKKNSKCELCDYTCSSQHTLREHNLNYHSTKEEREKAYKFYCKPCDVGKMYEVQFEEHLNSNKHKRMVEK